MKKNLLPAIALALVLGLLAITLWRDVVHELVLVPVSYLFWLVGLVYRSFDQQALWTAMLIVVLISALISLRLKPDLIRRPVQTEADPPQRVRLWKKRLDEAERGTYMRWRMAQHINALVVDSVAFRSGLTPEQIEKNIAANTADLPTELVSYLQAGRGFETDSSMSRRLSSSSIPQPLNLPPEAILDFLEEYLDLE